jgi:hypothetical protein
MREGTRLEAASGGWGIELLQDNSPGDNIIGITDYSST